MLLHFYKFLKMQTVKYLHQRTQTGEADILQRCGVDLKIIQDYDILKKYFFKTLCLISKYDLHFQGSNHLDYVVSDMQNR